MSIFNEYSHQILHHAAEQELIHAAEQRRLIREARGAAHPGSTDRRGPGRLVARVRRLLGRSDRSEGGASSSPVGSATVIGPSGRAAHRFAH